MASKELKKDLVIVRLWTHYYKSTFLWTKSSKCFTYQNATLAIQNHYSNDAKPKAVHFELSSRLIKS